MVNSHGHCFYAVMLVASFWSASSHRCCMSEDMLLKTGFGDETRCTGESGEGVGVCEQDSEREREL